MEAAARRPKPPKRPISRIQLAVFLAYEALNLLPSAAFNGT